MKNLTHQKYMNKALQLAWKGEFTVSPNPMVGCVIVKNDAIVGCGYHEKFGAAHAEINALKVAGEHAKGSTVYVTLEPCCYFGKTPPCTQALINAGIKEIYIATQDPNPLVSGKGIEELKNAGIKVYVGCCRKKAISMNEIFFHFIQTKTPFIISKWAMSLDGKTIVNSLDTKQISCSESTFHTHRLRQKVDAILVGANTIREDNPKLNVRYSVESLLCTKQPIRIVIAGKDLLPSDSFIFNIELGEKTILATTKQNHHLFTHHACTNVEILCVDANSNNQVCLNHLVILLGEKGITSILVEGGVKIRESFFEMNLVSRIEAYLAPVIIGSFVQKKHIHSLKTIKLHKDFCFSANLERKINV